MRRPADLGAAALLACGGVAALLYSNFLLDWTRRGFVGMDDIVSRLEAPGEPHAMLLRTTDVVCAVLVVALLPWVRAALPRGPWREVTVWATVGFAFGATVAALVPPPCGPDVVCAVTQAQVVHDISSIASDAALYVGVAAACVLDPTLRPDLVPPRRRVGLLARRCSEQRALRVLQRHRRPRLGPWPESARSHRMHQRLALCLAALAAPHPFRPPTTEEHHHVHTH